MKRFRFSLLAFAFITLVFTGSSFAEDRYSGAWDLEALAEAPEVEWKTESGTIRSLYYSGEAYLGKPTRVFAYYGVPEGTTAASKRPAMVLVHGGGGTAFREWVEIWVKRGYVAIAMDLAGRHPDKTRLPDGGPDQGHVQKFGDISKGIKNAWTYHAVANVIRAVSFLKSRPEVDSARIGITGISWGGYLTSLVSGLDNRLAVAVPVYGCGFLHENSVWLNEFEKLGEKQTRNWVRNFDPSQYLGQARMPMLFVNGTNDFAYPLDSYQKSYRLVKGPRMLCVTVRMKHSHPHGWAPKEIGMFVDSVLSKGKPLAKIQSASRDARTVTARFQSKTTIKKAELHFTTDVGAWQKREWKSVVARIEGNQVNATLPVGSGIVYFMTLTDERGAVVSTEHAEVR